MLAETGGVVLAWQAVGIAASVVSIVTNLASIGLQGYQASKTPNKPGLDPSLLLQRRLSAKRSSLTGSIGDSGGAIGDLNPAPAEKSTLLGG